MLNYTTQKVAPNVSLPPVAAVGVPDPAPRPAARAPPARRLGFCRITHLLRETSRIGVTHGWYPVGPQRQIRQVGYLGFRPRALEICMSTAAGIGCRGTHARTAARSGGCRTLEHQRVLCQGPTVRRLAVAAAGDSFGLLAVRCSPACCWSPWSGGHNGRRDLSPWSLSSPS